MPSPLFESNMAALAQCCARTHGIMESLKPGCRMEYARTGQPVPVLYQDGLPLHSLYDPDKEAQKVVAALNSPCVVFFGFGGGYWVKEALRSPTRQLAAVVDLQPEVTRAVMETVDLTELFRDPRFRFLPSPESIDTFYNSGLMGSLKVQVLASLERWNPRLVSDSLARFRKSLDSAVSDQVVQGRYARRWMLQTWRNLESLEERQMEFPAGKRIWVAGAGPSLEIQLKGFTSGDLLFAADTALPCLQSLGLEPDLVLTLDPQYYSLLHYLPGKPKGLLLLELGTNPTLGSLSPKTLYFFSHHPLHRWLQSQGMELPLLETRSGNVLGPLLDLAWSFFPREVLLAGADQAYPQGQVYARDTYQYHYHGVRTSRLTPLETAQTEILFRQERVVRTQETYMTEGQILTREKLARQTFSGKILQPPGKSPALLFAPPSGNPTQSAWKNRKYPSYKLKEKYLKSLSALKPVYPWLKWISSLHNEEKSLFDTLIPWFSWRLLHGKENKEENWPIILREIEEYLAN